MFDSPAKTIPELKLALEKGIYLNIDNFQEFERVKKLMEANNYQNTKIGIRVNPQVSWFVCVLCCWFGVFLSAVVSLVSGWCTVVTYILGWRRSY